jgi:hypothetical protein
MPGLVETNLHRIWAEKQTAKGTPATTGTKSFRFVGGTPIVAQPDMGSQAFSDGTAYGDAVDWINSLLGTGQPAFDAGTDELAYLLWLFHGAETVTPSGTNEVQTLTTTGTPTGGTVPLSFDGRATTVAFNSSAAAVQTALEGLPNIGTGNVVTGGGPLPTGVTITFQGALAKRPVPNIVTGSTGLTGGSSPTGVIAETTPGVNATHTFAPQNSLGFWSTWWTTVGSQNQQKLKQNDVRMGGVQIEASTGSKDLQISPQLLALDPAEVYTTDPVLAMPTKPVKRVPPLGSFSATLAKKDSSGSTIGTFSFTAPGVRWQIPASVAPNPGQGSGDISLTGSLRRLGSSALYSMSVGNQQAAYTA